MILFPRCTGRAGLVALALGLVTMLAAPALRGAEERLITLDAEDAYFRRDNPQAHADIVVDGTRLFEEQLIPRS